ncbi:MAG: SpoVG family protein [Fuerstiella sp.]|nr:SpoVG family protein [Fuerstiella sp.]
MEPTAIARQTGSSAAKEVRVEITQVRIKLFDDSSEHLIAFCTITIDREFDLRNLRMTQ